MKKIYVILVGLLSFVAIFAQSGNRIRFQAIIHDSDGKPVTTKVGLKLSVLNGDVESSALSIYSELFYPIPDNDGLINVYLGGNSEWNSISWAEGNYFLQTEVDPSGGTNYSISGTSQINCVPLAIKAKTSNSLYSNYTNGMSALRLNNVDDNDVKFAIKSKDDSSGLLFTTESGGNMSLFNNKKLVSSLSTDPNNNGLIMALSADGTGGAVVGFNDANRPSLAVMKDNQPLVQHTIDSYKNGLIQVSSYNSKGSSNLGFDHKGAPYMILDYNEIKLLGFSSSIEGTEPSGVLELFGPNGNKNVTISSHKNNLNSGVLVVKDENGTNKAGVYVTENGVGYIFADVKNFSVPHPMDSTKTINYASIEGPEVSAYYRGTAKLINGICEISLPDHYQMVTSNVDITVILTPLSAESKGLAAIEKSNRSIKVVELFNGSGTYSFDFEVKAIRKGYESYEVIKNKLQEVY